MGFSQRIVLFLIGMKTRGNGSSIHINTENGAAQKTQDSGATAPRQQGKWFLLKKPVLKLFVNRMNKAKQTLEVCMASLWNQIASLRPFSQAEIVSLDAYVKQRLPISYDK